MTGELVTADVLRALLRAATEHRAGTARQTRMGWTLDYGSWTLRSARIMSPRWFQTLDACVNMARELGMQAVIVELPSDQAAPPAAPPVPGKPSKRRARKR